MRAVQVRAFGAPEVLRVAEVEDPVPEAGEVLVAVGAAGVIFGDVGRVRAIRPGGGSRCVPPAQGAATGQGGGRLPGRRAGGRDPQRPPGGARGLRAGHRSGRADRIPARTTGQAAGSGRIGVYGFASGDSTIGTKDIGGKGLTLVGALGIVRAKPQAEQRANVEGVLRAVSLGELTPRIHRSHPLERAADAHADLEARRNIGAILLHP